MAIPAEKINYSEQPSGDVLSKIFSNIDIHDIWQRFLSKKDHLIFFYKVVVRSIDSCISGKYTDFDAQTTSNCCHGMSLLVRHLILSAHSLNLKQIQQRINQKISKLESDQADTSLSIDWLPWQVLALASLYMLTFVGIIDPNRGRKTHPQNLKLISPVGTKFSEKITRSLQKLFSNLVATSYQLYHREIQNMKFLSGSSVDAWGRYIQPNYLRKDKRGVQYAPCLFSMQISLGHLIHSRAKVAIINDLLDKNGQIKGRYICVFEGDGEQLRPLSKNEMGLFEPFDAFEPVIVFGGCAFSDSFEMDSLRLSMDKWLHHFPLLVLSCDVHYPQFPKVIDDPEFDNTPIVPKENSLRRMIEKSLQVQGVSPQDPSLFFLSHIYSAGLGQVLKLQEEDTALPYSSCYIPNQLFHSMLPEKLVACP